MDRVSVNMNLLRTEDVPEEILEQLRGENPVRADGQIYIRTGNRILCCEDSDDGEAMVRALAQKSDSERKEDPWQEILKSGKSAPRFRDEARCVLLFEAWPAQERCIAPETFTELAPTERGDAVTETEDGRIALIKRTTEHTEDEIAEFAAAVIETIGTETGIRAQAGIGKMTRETAGLKESAEQAAEAISIGRRFRPEASVYVYNRLGTERLISAIPAEARTKLRRELLSPETEKRMTPEIIETARAFLENDMNLTTTAKQLYIHRNTLIYRLDKIRKETGFDLRRFRDAAAFQMISQIPEEEI